ncbi:acyltransferase family protein [Formosa maritima]|nr:acyltransferase [Formosa maritima]
MIKALFKIDSHFENRIYGLDILRALAIMFVVIGHGIKVLPYGNFIRDVSMHLDFDGVSVFFVLSGFLIGGILIKILENQKATFKTLYNFWMRRWLRTLPNYFFILFLLVIVFPFLYTGHIQDSLSEKIKYVFFIQNLYYNHPYFFPEAWSLSIEEWFYLVVPVLMFALVGMLKMKPKKAVLIVSVSILILVTYFRYYKLMEFPIDSLKDWDRGFRKQVITRLDSLMFGVIGAYISFYYKEYWVKYKLILLIIGVVIFWLEKNLHLFVSNIGFGIYKSVFSFTISSIATLMTLPFLSQYKNGKGFVFKWVTIISLISYSMYLINLSLVQNYILTMFPEDLKEFEYLRYIAYWVVIILGSILLYKFIEIPFMKLRDKLAK